MRERVIEKALREGVEKLGGMCVKFVDPTRKGAPDRIVILDGIVDFVETKSPKGELKPWQQRYHHSLENAGAYIFTLWSLEDVNHFIKYLINRR